MLFALACAAILCLLFATVAAGGPRRAIVDLNATPSWVVPLAGAGAGPDSAADVKIADDGAVYVGGSLASVSHGADASLEKIVDGAPAWAAPATYDSPYHGDDHADKLALGPGHVIYTAGYSIGANGKGDVLLLKWSKSGTLLWARRYDGPGHGDDVAYALGVDVAGNVTVAATSVGATGSPDYALISWSAAGKQRWAWRYDGAFHGQDSPSDLLVAADGSVYVTGLSETASMKYAAVTARLSAAGKLLWLRSYAGPTGLAAAGYALAARPGGGVYVAGLTATAATSIDGLVVRYTPSGARTVFTPDTGAGGATFQEFTDVAVAANGEGVAVGIDNGRPRQVLYTADGTIAGALTWPTVGSSDYFTAVATDKFGGFYATGMATVAPGNVKVFSGRGSVLPGGGAWTSLWGPATVSSSNAPRALAVRGTTCVVVGTCNNGPLTGMDQFVLGYLY